MAGRERLVAFLPCGWYPRDVDQAAAIVFGLLRTLAPAAALFALLALVTKGRDIVATLRGVRSEAVTNVLIFFFNAGLLLLFFNPAVAAVSSAFDRSRPMAGFWSQLPEVLVVVIAIVVIDLVAYWRHRAEHSRLLWRIHATHHADTQLHWMSVHRKHPLGKLLSVFVDNALVLAIGVPAWAILAAALVRTWWGYFTHADLPWTLGVFGKVMLSPAAHRLHHIRDEELMGSNYGNTVAVWDLLFGTYRDPSPHLNCETGIEEGTRGFLGELVRPWDKRYRQASKRSKDNSDTVEVTAI